ncbi:MAG TPA: DUF6677 family protein [Pirellulales bacterium]|jgi:hypothetical protein|nr:DUF6677 family protein [Pirellulales bacterium]
MPETTLGKIITVPAGKNTLQINLRDPWLSALLAWLVPGLGHMYQRRWGKGGLLMTCILATFFYGLWLGGGRVVYASFRENDAHYAYLCQVAAGLPALPAIVQAVRVASVPPKAPLWDGFMAPPVVPGQVVPRAWVESERAKYPDDPEFRKFDTYDPRDPNATYLRYVSSSEPPTDQSAHWQYQQGGYYDLGTVFTMVAGLLNVLAIWDAWGGPAIPLPKPQGEFTDSTPSDKEEKK